MMVNTMLHLLLIILVIMMIDNSCIHGYKLLSRIGIDSMKESVNGQQVLNIIGSEMDTMKKRDTSKQTKGIKLDGIEPVPDDRRTEKRQSKREISES